MLRCDVYRYFPAIDHEILKRDLRRRVGCERTLSLGDRIVDGSNRQEPVNLYFPGDDLFAPYQRRRGLPIGNLTSQFFSNLYLDGLDHYCKEVLRAKGYLRYVDDFALFHDDRERLEDWRMRIERWLEGRRLRLHPFRVARTLASRNRRPQGAAGRANECPGVVMMNAGSRAPLAPRPRRRGAVGPRWASEWPRPRTDSPAEPPIRAEGVSDGAGAVSGR